MKKLKPQPLRDQDFADIKRQIEALFFEVIFKPALALLIPHSAQVKKAAKEMKNAAEDPIVSALKAGRIQYSNGVFSGDFNAAVSSALRRAGAKLNKTTKVFALAPDLVSTEVKAAAHQYQDAARKLHEELDKQLARVEADLKGILDKKGIDATVMLGRVQRAFKDSVGDALGHAELSDETKAKLQKEYTDSLRPFIEGFSRDTIHELREAVESNALEGYRFDRLIDRFQSRYDVSKSKAEFLARNETARYVSMHRRAKFAESGVTQYIWHTANDSRVREDHKALNGKIFSYSNPPIVDLSTGRKANPGMDYQCRCSDEPILPEFTRKKNVPEGLTLV